jgi:hypothetical protein
MTHDVDRRAEEMVHKLRKIKGFCPMTAEEADAAFDASPAAAMSGDEIQSVLRFVRSRKAAVPDSNAAFAGVRKAGKLRRFLLKALIAAAASLGLVAASWWLVEGTRTSLYAQVIDGVHRAQTIHVIRYGYQEIKGKVQRLQNGEAWFDRGVGFRKDGWLFGAHRCVALGNKEYTWAFDRDRDAVLRSRSKGIAKQAEDIFSDIDDNARRLQNDGRRYPEGDRTFDGEPCKAYQVTKLDRFFRFPPDAALDLLPGSARSRRPDAVREVPPPDAARNWRVFQYLDRQSRLVRTVIQARVGDRWEDKYLSIIRYDEHFGPTLFQPDFRVQVEKLAFDENRSIQEWCRQHVTSDVKILDADAERAKEAIKPQGPVLVYEIDPKSRAAGITGADMDNLVKIVGGRLNAGPEKLATVRKLDDRRLEIALMRQSDADKKRVEEQLARSGTLEFRILANNRFDKAVIDRARHEPTKTELLDSYGKRSAWWVPVTAGQERSFAGYPEIARRTRKVDDRKVTEILVVSDPYNVTGAYFTAARCTFNFFGTPCLEFTLNDKGGELFGKLTGDHLPDKSTDFSYKLGIILNGELVSAPSVQSRIYNRGEITGSFTKEQVGDLVATLNSGSLPVRLRLVEQHPQQ